MSFVFFFPRRFRPGVFCLDSFVERGISQRKQRFHILHIKIRVKFPTCVCRIIEVCAMLHNICKDRNLSFPEYEQQEVDEVDLNRVHPCLCLLWR